MSDIEEVVTLDKAAELVGGDKPVSRSTIQRLINDGVLKTRGKGQLRRVLVSSINAYNSGETTWQGAGRTERARPFKTARASGGQRFRSEKDEPGARVVLIGRTPRER